nr:hypothetical protein [Tanacetum cinerariifolium]
MQLIEMWKWKTHFPWHVNLTLEIVPSYRKVMSLSYSLSKTKSSIDEFSSLKLSVLTADVYISKKLSTVEDFALLDEDKIYSESKTRESLGQKETAKDKGPAGEVSSLINKKGRTVAITAEDMQKMKNDVKARTTLLLALPGEHQNEATKKTKKNQLKQQYGNFKAEGSETLEQTFNSGKSEVPTIQGASTASVQVPTVSTNVAAASLSYDTVCAFIATQPNRSQIKYEEISQIDDDDIEEMDIKWNLALLSMRADRFWKKSGKKITIQGSDVASFDKSKVECFNCHKMGHFVRECRSPRSQDRGKRERESYKKNLNVEELAPKAMIAIDDIGWD